MFRGILKTGRKIFTEPQNSVFSAASVIMVMIVASRVLGLIRSMVLLEFFPSEQVSLFFAAFRLPDTIFEILVFGTFSSAFIPVFTKAAKKNNKDAWELSATIINLGILLFGLFAILVGAFAEPLYSFFAPGYADIEREMIVKMSRVLLTAQLFFVLSYVLTGSLESLKRFFVPALAPLFYNLGIIFGTVVFAQEMGLMAPTFGVLIGAALHFLIQLPLALRLGFRFKFQIKITDDVKKIGRLAAPRILEVSFLQISKMVELFLASMITTASYAYFYLANSLQLLPVGLFGTSIAKAALPTLSSESDDLNKFSKILWNSLYFMVFLILPLATILIILRIPVVRLVYGRELFDWRSTVQTGEVLSAFGFGIVFQAVTALLARSFYALHDTQTPVIVSIVSMLITIAANFILIRGFNTEVWGLAASFSLGSFFQASTLFYLINKRMGKSSMGNLIPMFKSLLAAIASGIVMFVLIKLFDQSVWIKRLSFLSELETVRNLPFQGFVLDTRYTVNLLLLTLMVSIIGIIVYLLTSILLKNKQVWVLFSLIKRMVIQRRKVKLPEGTDVVTDELSQ